jgi:hypothetical protein
LKEKQDGILDKGGTMDNVQEHNICIIIVIFLRADSVIDHGMLSSTNK